MHTSDHKHTAGKETQIFSRKPISMPEWKLLAFFCGDDPSVDGAYIDYSHFTWI